MAEEIKTSLHKPRGPTAPAAARPPEAPAAAKPDEPIRPGAKVRQYELIRELGRGGMGVVYLARDTRLGRRVAMKFLLAGSHQLSERFLGEARATASCHHENIVVIHEVGQHERFPYMVLEYLEGQSLRGFIKGRQLGPQRVVELMLPVARALVRAHEQNIVHRDLKPENVFVTTSGTLKVLDFGIAALFSDKKPPKPASTAPVDDDFADTSTSTVSGTLPYMAPELFGDENADQRADLWALGIMLYEMLAGHHPIQPLTGDQLMRNILQLDQAMPRVADEVAEVPYRLGQLVARCLQKRMEQRIATAREVLEELESLLPSRVHRQFREDESPYPGLVAFQEDEADRFFGRGRDVLQVTARLREHPLGAIVGPSGVGKSSFVRAGVIPALKSSGERWESFVLRPGRQPLHSMATMLQPLTTSAASIEAKMAEHESILQRLREEPGYLGAVLRSRAVQRHQRILLFVDQFEELYTLAPDEAERRAFTACLSGVADDTAAPLRVLVSLRSDFLDRVGEDKRFAEEVTRGLVLLQPLGREALREALKAPVEQLGHAFETPEMIEEMVQALVSTPGALPLLQFAGSKLWEARDPRRKVLTDASYRQMGGITGVLAQHADQVVLALPPPMQRLARALFQRLVTSDGTRAIIGVPELADLAGDVKDVQALVDRLVQARLLVVQGRGAEGSMMRDSAFFDATVELVHESLITGWPLLRRWLDEGRDDAAFREQLRAAARQWHGRGKPQGLLWRGEAEEEARLWRARHADVVPPKEQEFLDAVFALATRAQRVRRTIAVGTIAFLSLVVALGGAHLHQGHRAERRAVDEAGLAGREAERARSAEAQVKSQLDLLKREQEAKRSAQAEVQRGKKDLSFVNEQLELALKKAEDETQREHKLAESVQKANARLEKLLADERARAEKLERERRKITTELR
jgi:serine/threonine protein kinase